MVEIINIIGIYIIDELHWVILGFSAFLVISMLDAEYYKGISHPLKI